MLIKIYLYLKTQKLSMKQKNIYIIIQYVFISFSGFASISIFALLKARTVMSSGK